MSDIKNISKNTCNVSRYRSHLSGYQYNLDSICDTHKGNSNKYAKLDGSNHIESIDHNDQNSFNCSTFDDSFFLCKADELDCKKNELYSKNNEIDNKYISSIMKNFEINDIYKSNFIKNKFNDKEYENIINYPSSTKEWFNSVYSYNKSYNKPLVALYLFINKLFYSYFNMVECKVKNIFKRRRAKKYNYSSKKVHLSRAELKHTSTSIIIILYIHNRSKFIHEQYTRRLVNFVWTKEIKSFIKKKKNFLVKKNNIWYILKKRFSSFNIFNIVVFNLNNSLKIRLLNKIQTNLSMKLKFLSIFFYFKKFSIYNYIKTYDFIILNKLFRLEEVFFKNAKFINFNKSKFNNLLLNLRDLGLVNILNKIYDKNVQLKIVNLKSIHLNSDVFSSAVTIKLRNRNNKAVNILRKALMHMVKIPSLHTLIVHDDSMKACNKNNVLDFIKDQITSGVRFEASGRLTKRLTALRAVFKRKYIGSLKDVRSSYNKKSSTMLRGHVKSNLQYTIVQSKTRNGSFGLKGWLSSH